MENTAEIAQVVQEAAISWGPALAVAGAALAAGLGGIGSAIGVGLAGQAGTALTAEKPDAFGKALVLEALPGSQGIYGLMGAFLIYNFFLQNPDMAAQINTQAGLEIMFASLPLALTALFSGMYQGRVATAGMQALARNEAVFGKAMVLAAIVETFAILGFLSTFILFNNLKGVLAATIA